MCQTKINMKLESSQFSNQAIFFEKKQNFRGFLVCRSLCTCFMILFQEVKSGAGKVQTKGINRTHHCLIDWNPCVIPLKSLKNWWLESLESMYYPPWKLRYPSKIDGWKMKLPFWNGPLCWWHSFIFGPGGQGGPGNLQHAGYQASGRQCCWSRFLVGSLVIDVNSMAIFVTFYWGNSYLISLITIGINCWNTTKNKFSQEVGRFRGMFRRPHLKFMSS